MTAADLRRAVCAHLRSTLPPRWSEAPVPFNEVLRGMSRTIAAPAWSVGIGASTAGPSRQVPAGFTLAETEVVTRYVVPLRADAHAPDSVGETDTDLALDAEAELLDALLSIKTSTESGVYLTWRDTETREAVGDGSYLTAVIRCTALHAFGTGS